MDPARQNPIWLTCKPLQRMCSNRMQHITTIRSSLLMFRLTPDQHHWLDVATEFEGWCSFTSCTPSRSRARTDSQTKTRELVHFVALQSNWFYFIFEYITTYATTTSVFRGTTFGEAVALTTIFSHRLCTNVSWIAAKDRGGAIEILPKAWTVTTITICESYRNCYYG